ncbi:MAG: fatty acid desaturase [Planctomycetes bacterium]|nr:fatty acid desaturase [Planctomycetota bacterium]
MSPLPESRAATARWNRILAPFFGPETRRSVVQLVSTAVPFAGFWALSYLALDVSFWLTLALAFPAAGFLVRLFMIQHDCGHGSFFRSPRARDWTGRVLGVLTLTPYEYWRKTHAWHHAHSGDLDHRGFGDIDTLTVEEYRALSWFRRLGYRLYRHPAILFTVGPLFHFVLIHRFPWTTPRAWKKAWRSVLWTNVALAGIVVLAHFTIGLRAFLLVQGPVVAITCMAGVWLFYVQHQFETAYWRRHGDWNPTEAALEGASHLALPWPLSWLTADIGIHHVHHLSSRIPNYRLREALTAVPELANATRLRIRDTLRPLSLALFDETAGRLVRFRDARRAYLPSGTAGSRT